MPEMRACLIWNPVAGRRRCWARAPARLRRASRLSSLGMGPQPHADAAPSGRRQQIESIARELRVGGWAVELAETVPGEGARPAAEAAVRAGCEVLIGCGGDGTLAEIAQAVYSKPAPYPALGVVALGTANVLAHALGCAIPVQRAAAWLLAAQPKSRPLGVAVNDHGKERYFLSVASAGLDAQVVHGMSDQLKRRWGKLAYAGSAWRQAWSYFPAPIDFDCDGQRGSADGIVLGLSRFYGGRLKLGRVSEGEAIVLALRGAPWWLPCQALALATVGLEHGPRVERLASSGVRLLTAGRPVELDGEAAGMTPVELRVRPGGARVLMR